jgi:hypothetical protein
LSSAGDVNADGYSDLAVGAPGHNGNTGKVYVFHGSATGLAASADWSKTGEASTNYFGTVAPAGDVNGDGYSDLAVGALGFSVTTGKAYLFLGSAGGLSVNADWSQVGEGASDTYGHVASAGDFDGDGYGDLAVGAQGFDNYRGKVYLYRGSPGGLNLTADLTLLGEMEESSFSFTASAGDVNGDGFPDLAVGAPWFGGYTGKVYLYHGSATLPGCDVSCLRVAMIRMKASPTGVTASVQIRDENGLPISGARVLVHWDLPGGEGADQGKKTDASGSVVFTVPGGAGTYTISIADVMAIGYTFDPLNSAVLSKSITK